MVPAAGVDFILKDEAMTLARLLPALTIALSTILAVPAHADPAVDSARNVTALAASWDAFTAGDMDGLVTYYADDMIFVMPGQGDVLEGKEAFRAALDGIGDAIPPGFAVTGLRYAVGTNEVVNIVEWTADKVPDGSTLAITFRFGEDGLITEERWFVDTEQWKAAF